MFEDVEKTLALANSPQKAPNFLLALALCCYTEYWGKLKLGVAEPKHSKSAFMAFLEELDYQHYSPIKLQVYKDVRCGLAHSYLIEKKNSDDLSME